MPKIKQEEDFEDEDDEEDDEDEEDLETDEDYESPPRRIAREMAGEKVERRKPLKSRAEPKEEEVKRRFGLIGPQPLRIVDTETNELVGEGEFAVIQALTDILERLERIEVQIGAITG